MSDVQTGFEPPVGNVPPAKKGNKLWVFGGVGCLLASLLCAGAIAYSVYAFSGVIAAAFAEITSANDAIQNSPQVQAELGSPLNLEQGQPAQSGQAMIVDGTVSGPDGSGTYRIRLSTDGTTFTTDSITVEANGKTIVVGDEIGELESALDGIEDIEIGIEP